MTPEAYHLTRAPELRDELKAQFDALAEAEKQEHFRALVSAARAAGLRIPNTATPHEWNRDTIVVTDGVSIRLQKTPLSGAVAKQRAALSWRRRAICKLLNPSAARRFSLFARTKYGKKPDDATIAKAHEEWLDLQTDCEC